MQAAPTLVTKLYINKPTIGIRERILKLNLDDCNHED